MTPNLCDSELTGTTDSLCVAIKALIEALRVNYSLTKLDLRANHVRGPLVAVLRKLCESKKVELKL